MNASTETATRAAQRTLHSGNGADAGERLSGDEGFVQSADSQIDYDGAATTQASSQPRGGTEGLDQALACFSIGLGLFEFLAPHKFGRLIGTSDHATLIRLCGLREIASGVALLSPRTAANAAASRVAGDAMDLTLLGAAFAARDADRARLAVATTAVLGATALDVYATRQHARSGQLRGTEGVPVSVSIAINSTPQKLYAFWRNFENLPTFMRHLESVTRIDDRTSRWEAKGPVGGRVQWESDVIEDRANELIAWRTRPDSDIQHSGRVAFEDAGGGRGSIVHVEMVYLAPGGLAGAALGRVLGEEPGLQIRRDLRRLKQLLETGEVTTTQGQPTGRRSVLGKVLTRRES